LWLSSLDLEAKNHVRKIIAAACEQTAFGIMCVLDGVRVVSEEQTTEPPGEFVLEFRTQHKTVLLNDQ
jgi:hypothetical protein